MDAVADGDHDFLESEEGLGRGLRGGGRLLSGGGDCQQDRGEKQLGWAQRFSPCFSFVSSRQSIARCGAAQSFATIAHIHCKSLLLILSAHIQSSWGSGTV